MKRPAKCDPDAALVLGHDSGLTVGRNVFEEIHDDRYDPAWGWFWFAVGVRAGIHSTSPEDFTAFRRGALEGLAEARKAP